MPTRRTQRALLQEATSAPEAAALTPPKLVTFVDAIYPPAAKAAGLQADVDLELTIDVTGAVAGARVITPVGNEFDEAALEAVRRFIFEPAKRGGKAIPARITYRYVFELAAEAAPIPNTGELEGKVLSRGDNRIVAGALVTLSATDGQPPQTAITDPSGAFHFSMLSPGRFHVQLAASGLGPLGADEDVAAGELTSVIYRMDVTGQASAVPALEFGATATIEAPPREVTKRSLSGEELLRVAGTRGDPLKAIEYMPGVGRSPQAEYVIIRGSSPADSEVEFEGAPVYRLYHFGGLTSFVQPRLLDKIDLYPGNFSVRFGRKMGGIIDVGVRDPKTDALHAMVDINLVDSSFLFEGPLAKNWSFAVAAKRSYFDLFIDKLVPKDQAQITEAPVYWDYQAMLAYKPSSNDRFRAMVYGSYDDLKLILAHPADGDPAIRGGVSSNTVFHRAQLTWQHQYNAAIEHEISVSTGPFSFAQTVGPDLAIQIPGYEGFLRSEWRARLTDQLRLLGGLDVSYNWFNFSYDGPRPTQVDGDPDTFGPLTGRQDVQLHGSYGFLRPAAYLEGIWQITPRLTVVPGGRVDYLGDVDRWTFDPRVTARYQLTATTIIKGGVGLFSQAPSGAESLPVLGNPHLRPGRAEHYSLGFEQEVGTRLKVTAEGFYKTPQRPDGQQSHSGREPEQRRHRSDLRRRGIGEAAADGEVQRVHLVHALAQRAQRSRRGMAAVQLGSDPHPHRRGSLPSRPRLGSLGNVPLRHRQPAHPCCRQHLQRQHRHLQADLRRHQQRPQQRLPSAGPARREEPGGCAAAASPPTWTSRTSTTGTTKRVAPTTSTSPSPA